MSCNGCRVLRKGCSDTCVLRPCLQWIDSPESQAHATIFVAKFFGRAGLLSFISAVPESQRSALFQSLLFEACGRTANPVTGAVGLLGSGSWDMCQSAVETVLRGGKLNPSPDSKIQKRKRSDVSSSTDLSLSLRMSCLGSEYQRSESPSMEYGESGTTWASHGSGKMKLLDLF